MPDGDKAYTTEQALASPCVAGAWQPAFGTVRSHSATVALIGYFWYRAVKFQGVKGETVDKEWHG